MLIDMHVSQHPTLPFPTMKIIRSDVRNAKCLDTEPGFDGFVMLIVERIRVGA